MGGRLETQAQAQAQVKRQRRTLLFPPLVCLAGQIRGLRDLAAGSCDRMMGKCLLLPLMIRCWVSLMGRAFWGAIQRSRCWGVELSRVDEEIRTSIHPPNCASRVS